MLKVNAQIDFKLSSESSRPTVPISISGTTLSLSLLQMVVPSPPLDTLALYYSLSVQLTGQYFIHRVSSSVMALAVPAPPLTRYYFPLNGDNSLINQRGQPFWWPFSIQPPTTYRSKQEAAKSHCTCGCCDVPWTGSALCLILFTQSPHDNENTFQDNGSRGLSCRCWTRAGNDLVSDGL